MSAMTGLFVYCIVQSIGIWVVVFRSHWISGMWDALKRIIRTGGGPYRALQDGVTTYTQAQQRGYPDWRDHVGFLNPSQSVRPLEAWTPAERDALGVNDTEKWILETDRILGQIEWERTVAKMDQTPIEPNEIPPLTFESVDFTKIQAGTITGAKILATPVAMFADDKPVYSFETHDQGEAVFQ